MKLKTDIAGTQASMAMDLTNPLLKSSSYAARPAGLGGTTMNLTGSSSLGSSSLGGSLRNPLLEMHSAKSSSNYTSFLGSSGDSLKSSYPSALGGHGPSGATYTSLTSSHLTENTLLKSLSSNLTLALGSSTTAQSQTAEKNAGRKQEKVPRPHFVQMFGPTPPSSRPKVKTIVSKRRAEKTRINDTNKVAQKVAKRVKLQRQMSREEQLAKISPEEIIPLPQYELEIESDDSGIEIPRFPIVDPSVELADSTIRASKKSLVDLISASLLRQPDFKTASDRTRLDLMSLANACSEMDPEFILKAALYTRCELNIRSTANFLLAFAAFHEQCRPFLRRYYCASIRLPSDWIDVAEQYQIFKDSTISDSALPAALRRVMVTKFPEFDKYQLAKYNKDSSAKKKQKAKKEEQEKKESEQVDLGQSRGRGGFRGGFRGGRGGRGGAGAFRATPRSPDALEDAEKSPFHGDEEAGRGSDNEDDVESVKSDQSDDEEETRRKTFTLKQLIRKLHITEPVDNVMGLIGKKYPSNSQEFYLSRLPGVFDENQAGKRMKLPTPETWETQVSMKGNRASTWEDLIDHKKLPFMAMLRNLRNLIKAGISEKHHNWVIKKLTDDYAVINSRVFPFQFFAAYDALSELQRHFEVIQEKLVKDVEVQANPVRQRGRGRKNQIKRKPKETLYDTRIIERYRKAIDMSVKIATTYNVTPIKGKSRIFVYIGRSSMRNCGAMRSSGKPRQAYTVALLLGLMCKYACEDSNLYLYNDTGSWEVDVEKGTILDNIERLSSLVLSAVTKEPTDHNEGDLSTHILRMVQDNVKIDNMLLFGSEPGSRPDVESFALPTYRAVVNPDLFVVTVNLLGSSRVEECGPNSIYIAGYSDAILRFIAERGNDSQLMFVEHIDEKYQLKPMPRVASDKLAVPRPLAVPNFRPRWRTARVFISSTFRDMHGERDLLTRFVFPELRSRAAKRFINVYEVDLRWGITEEETQSNKSVEICLSEVSRCQFFIGLLGARYGWTVSTTSIDWPPDLQWVQYQPDGTSVTELEMYAGALSMGDMEQRAFFFLRDQSFEKNVPKEFQNDFVSESDQAAKKMRELKEKIKSSGLEVYDGYPCHWGGVCDGKPIVAGLEEFGKRVLNNMWNGLLSTGPENENIDEVEHESAQHQAFMDAKRDIFYGRNRLLADSLKKLTSVKSGIVALIGKAGTGKTSLFASLLHEYQFSTHCDNEMYIVSHVVGVTIGSAHIVALLRRLCCEMSRRFGLSSAVPDEYQNLVGDFNTKLVEASSMCSSPLVVAIDGLDGLHDSYNAASLSWLPEEIPQNVVFLLSAKDGSNHYRSILRRKPVQIQVGPLDSQDKALVARQTLALHNKTLDESTFHNQLKVLLAKKDASNALFLSLACDELRLFGLFDMVDEKLKMLPPTVSLLLQHIMERLENDLGRNLVSSALCLLTCSRNGLDELDLHALLSLKQLVSFFPLPQCDDIMFVQVEPTDMLPQSIFKQLLHGIQPFLKPFGSEESEHLSLANADVEVAIKQRYMHSPGNTTEKAFHILLAGYFMQHARSPSNSITGFSEAPYHLASSGDFANLKGLLCDLDFIESKCRLGLGAQLLEDYQATGSGGKLNEFERQKFLKDSSVIQYQAFVEKNLHILCSNPTLTTQQALNDTDGSLPNLEAKDTCDISIGRFEWTNRPTGPGACVRTINSIDHTVTALSISENGQLMAMGTDDCNIKIYNISTGRVLQSLHGHASKITDVCFINDCILASAAADNSISVWDIVEGYRLTVLKGHTRLVSSLAWSREAQTLVSGSWDCKVKLWKASQGGTTFKMEGEIRESRPVNCVCFHPDGKFLATGSWDATIKVWDINTRVRRAVLRGHSSSVRAICYSPTGMHIASASLQGHVYLWSAMNGQQVAKLTGHSLPVNKLTFSPQGHELITVSDDHKVKVWSGDLGKLLMQVVEKETGGATACAIQPDGAFVVVGFNEGLVKAYSTKTGEVRWEAKHHTLKVRSICYFKDSKSVITGSDDCSVKILNAETGKVTEVLAPAESGQSPKGGISCVAQTTNGDFLAVASDDACTYVYLRDILFNDSGPPVLLACLHDHDGSVTGCAFNMDDMLLATCSKDASVFIYQVSTIQDFAKPVLTLSNCHKDWINSVVWSNTTNHLITASNDFHIKLWDGKTGELKTDFPTRSTIPYHVTCKNNCVVTCHLDGTANVWTSKGIHITTLKSKGKRTYQADIYVKTKGGSAGSDDLVDSGDWAAMVEEDMAQKEKSKSKTSQTKVLDIQVVTASDNGSVQLWRPMEGNEQFNLEGHSGKVLSVSCSPDNTIATSATDKTMRLWKPQSSHSIRAEGHRSEVMALTFINDDIFVSGSKTGEMKIWETSEKLPRCLYTLQAHEKSIEDITGCGVIASQTAFATVSMDQSIKVWLMKSHEGTTSVKLHCEFTSDEPLRKVLFWARKGKKGACLVTISWRCKVTVWMLNADKTSVGIDLEKDAPLCRPWPVNATIDNDELFIIASNSNLFVVKLLEQNDMHREEVFETDISSNNRITSAVIEGRNTLYVAVSGNEKGIYNLDDKYKEDISKWASGQPEKEDRNPWMCEDPADLKQRQKFTPDRAVTRSEEVNCLVKSPNGLIFAACHNSIINVWKDKEQVGQFFTPAPVTQMAVLPGQEGPTFNLIAADCHGNIMALKWIFR